MYVSENALQFDKLRNRICHSYIISWEGGPMAWPPFFQRAPPLAVGRSTESGCFRSQVSGRGEEDAVMLGVLGKMEGRGAWKRENGRG